MSIQRMTGAGSPQWPMRVWARRGTFFEEGGEGREDVRDGGGDVQDDGHVVGCGLHREAGGVVEEYLV